MPHDEEQVIAEGNEQTISRESARRTRRSFLVGGVSAAAGYGLWKLAESGNVIGRQPLVLRREFQANAGIFRGVFAERGLAPEYPLSRARELRLNGTIGMNQTLDLASWRLQVVGSSVGKGSPLWVPDVTAWQYKYLGEMQPDQQAFDVKSAPGNTLGNPKDNDDDDDDDKAKGAGQQPAKADEKPGQAPAADKGAGGKAPGEHKSSPSGKAGQSSKGNTAQEPGAGAGSGQPATDAATAKTAAGSPNSAGLSIEERFNRMREQITHKRYQGTAEAGASASSLDIGTPGLLLSMNNLLKLPRAEKVMEFHCIEGWSNITQWAGFHLRDFVDAYPPAKVNGREPRYVYMETPDGDYYGGYDLDAIRHPQSLIVTEMGGKPLSQEHGAPARLFTPLKYGYKNLKRIGLIAYTDTRPDDYWTKLGYDWYAGL